MTIYIGAVAPETVKVTVRRGALGIDMTTASAAVFEVSRPDRTTTEWPAVISNATTEQLDLTHAFESSDLTMRGDYYLVPKLTVPGGFIRAQRVTVPAVDPFRR